MRNLKILVTVVDKTQKPLEDVKKRVKGVGKSTRDATIDLTKFNRGLFSATAIAATFTRAFIGVGRAISEGADWDRLTTQFDRAAGSSARFLDVLGKTTDVAIDKTEALKAGLSLANLGISKDMDSLASLIAKAGVAAKLAGKDSAEGINSISQFLKTGNVSQLQNLDLLHEANLAYKTQQAVLGKFGGVLGGVISLQHRLALGQALLDAKTKGQLKGFTDIKDVIRLLSEEYKHLKNELGVLLGKAVLPLAKGFTELIIKIRQVIQNVKNNKEVLFFAKSILVASAAVTTLIGTFATLKGVMFALTSIGFGLPKLITLTTILGSTFLGITAPIKTVEEKLKVLGAIFKGTWELITTFDSDTGLAKMSKATFQLLKQNGLLGFVQFLGRAGRLVYVVATDIWNAFKWLGKKVDDTFGGIARSIFNFFDLVNKPWENFILSDKLSEANKAARALIVTGGILVSLFAGKKLLGALGGVLSKIPGIGKLFGGGGKGSGPSGAVSDPFYVIMADKALGLLKSIPGVGKIGGIFSGGLGKLTGFLSGAFQNLILKSKILGEIFTHPAGKLRGLMAVFTSFGKTFIAAGKGLLIGMTGLAGTLLKTIVSVFAGLGPILGPAIAVGAAGLIGYGIGTAINHIIEKYLPTFEGKTDEGFEGGAMERGLFKLSKWTGIGPAQEFIDNQEKMRKNEEAALKRINEIRSRQGKPPVSSLEEIGNPESPTRTTQLFTPMNQTTAASTPLPADHELEMLDKLGQSLSETPNSSALTMQKEYEKMLNQGKKPSEIVAEKQLNMLEEQTDFLKIISQNTAPQNKSLMKNPMDVSR